MLSLCSLGKKSSFLGGGSDMAEGTLPHIPAVPTRKLMLEITRGSGALSLVLSRKSWPCFGVAKQKNHRNTESQNGLGWKGT